MSNYVYPEEQCVRGLFLGLNISGQPLESDALLLKVQSEAYCLIASLCRWVNRSPKGSAIAFNY